MTKEKAGELLEDDRGEDCAIGCENGCENGCEYGR
jgi:hypothetical protein